MIIKVKMVKKLTLVLEKKVVSIFLKIRPATHLPLIHPHIKFQPFRPIILGDMASLHLRISRIPVLYVHPSVNPSVSPSVGWLVGWLVGWSVGRLVGWSVPIMCSSLFISLGQVKFRLTLIDYDCP